MRYLITGASGFLGRELVAALCKQENTEIIASTSKQNFYTKEKGYPNVYTVGYKEYRQFQWDKIDILINCAFPRNTDGTNLAEGITYISDLLKYAADGGVGSVVNISSQSVYSQKRKTPATETSPICLESPYAVGKYATELMTNTMCAKLNHTNLRMSSLIGPCFNQRILNRFIKSVLNGEEIVITEGTQRFGLLDVRDAAEAIITICESKKRWKECYNVGNSCAYTPREIAESVARFFYGDDLEKVIIRVEGEGKDFCSVVDATTIYKDFDWKYKYSLEDTIKEIVKAEK